MESMDTLKNANFEFLIEEILFSFHGWQCKIVLNKRVNDTPIILGIPWCERPKFLSVVDDGLAAETGPTIKKSA